MGMASEIIADIAEAMVRFMAGIGLKGLFFIVSIMLAITAWFMIVSPAIDFAKKIVNPTPVAMTADPFAVAR